MIEDTIFKYQKTHGFLSSFKHHNTTVEHSAVSGTLTTSQYETEKIEVKLGGQLGKKKLQERAKTWKWGLFLLGSSSRTGLMNLERKQQKFSLENP